MPRCPICDKDAAPRAAKTAFPFCSPRCKQIDLGRWLNEEYRIPVEAPAEDDGSGSARPPAEEPS